ncbi:hypothetical protein GCM10022243_57350 [Saccharothrix violaceirubra]|uniref:MFS transporter n=1 Tax=Saccharothrix violaceirubra TaxID=413306 RepID=A0A7W7T3D6_9PSEU|nr:hypothetical protein [Saccharothrix violaceirubra]MBB4965833.1 hypothetical protein [Saccharothrix violaceirubra]
MLFYAFPVLSGRIAVDTGWSAVTLTAWFSAARSVSGLVGIPVGRWPDRRGPRVVMAVGSAVAVATAHDPVWFAAGWLVVGVAMGMVLYPSAFAGTAPARLLGGHASAFVLLGVTTLGTAFLSLATTRRTS